MSAFDPLAATYDNDFTNSPIPNYLRNIVHQRLTHHFQPKTHILELGCGTGEDAAFLAKKDIFVTATDVSQEMLAQAQQKASDYPQIRFQYLDLNQPQTTNFDRQFDGVFANFGPLNCVADLGQFAGWLAKQIKGGSIVGFAIMSPFCLWEIAWHSLHSDFSTAFRRLKKQAKFRLENNIALNIYYPSVKHLTRIFQPHFRRVYLRPLGLFLPPSDVYGVIEKRPKLLNRLLTLENRLGHISQLALLADHYWIEFERTTY